MDKRTDARLKAMILSENCQQSNSTEWTTMTPIVKINTRIQAVVAGIVSNSVATGMKSNGVTLDKKFKQAAMLDLTMIVASSVYSYADDNEDMNELKTNADISEWKIKRMSDEEKADACDFIVSLANANITAMGTNYIIKQLDIDKLADHVLAFRNHIPKPRETILNAATARRNIQILMKEGYTLLKKLDKLMTNFKNSNYEFYSQYFKARNIILKSGKKKDTGTDDGGDAELPPAEDEYAENVLKGKIIKVAFLLKPELTYLLTLLKGKKIKYWTSANPTVPTAIPEVFSILDMTTDVEATGVALEAATKPYLFFANDDTEDAEVAVDVLEE